MYPILIVALLAFFTTADTFPVSQNFLLNATVAPPTAYVFTFEGVNLKNTATFRVVSTADLVFCFQEQYSVFANSTPVVSLNPAYFSNSNCRFYYRTSGNATQNIPLLMVPYAVAVYFQNATGLTTTEVSVELSGDVCGANQVADPSGNCLDAQPINDKLALVEVPANTSFAAYRFSLSSSRLTGSFTISLPAGNQLKIWMDRDGTPARTTPRTLPYTLDFPRNGLHGYFLLVSNEQATPQNFTITMTECTNNTGGPGCAVNIANAATVPDLVLIESTVYYYRVDATNVTGVWASVRGVNGTNTQVVNPLIFASMNQLPQADNADVTVCNQYYCDFVNSINFNVSSNQTWYIGIQNMKPIYNGSIAGIWFNSLCAPGCSDHGECATSGPQTGYCDCIDGFIGVDCNTPNGFGPQFIVLIIIAVLVALTAVIGFGAWAYMRRKRGQYDIVS